MVRLLTENPNNLQIASFSSRMLHAMTQSAVFGTRVAAADSASVSVADSTAPGRLLLDSGYRSTTSNSGLEEEIAAALAQRRRADAAAKKRNDNNKKRCVK